MHLPSPDDMFLHSCGGFQIKLSEDLSELLATTHKNKFKQFMGF